MKKTRFIKQRRVSESPCNSKRKKKNNSRRKSSNVKGLVNIARKLKRPLTERERFFATFLFRRVRAGKEKNNSVSTSLHRGLQYKFIDPNNRGYIRVLTLDVDWAIPLADYLDKIPTPNVISANPENGHVHIMYFLKDRLYIGNQRVMFAYQQIRANLTRILNADLSFAGRLQKNPLHPYWETTWFNCDPYPLTDLINWSMKQETGVEAPSFQTNPIGRHMTIFDALRKYAYKHKKDLSLESLRFHAEQLNLRCPEFNTFHKSPLDKTELYSISDSIYRFMKFRYTGVGGIGQYTDTHRRLSAQVRTQKMWIRIYRFLWLKKLKVSISNLHTVLCVTKRTIRNYCVLVKCVDSTTVSEYVRVVNKKTRFTPWITNTVFRALPYARVTRAGLCGCPP